MKSANEIRKRIADTKIVRNLPCNCPAEGSSLGCLVGGQMMDASVSVLEWVLGESPMEERVAEWLAADSSRLGGQK